jgi:Leucine-rich repeat (LRR) protein
MPSVHLVILQVHNQESPRGDVTHDVDQDIHAFTCSQISRLTGLQHLTSLSLSTDQVSNASELAHLLPLTRLQALTIHDNRAQGAPKVGRKAR